MFKVYNEGEAMCPNDCGWELDSIEIVDTTITWYGVKTACVGSCPVCGKKFRWNEFFSFEGTGKPEPIEE